jgi:hypothetical protein
MKMMKENNRSHIVGREGLVVKKKKKKKYLS